ncbi:MAG: hypothetical protein ACLGHN_03210 [Bacteriovoracia bacterium]
MDKPQKPLTILNLTGELIPELAEYFSSKNIEVVDPLVNNEQKDWTHIITKDIHNFDHLNIVYDLIKQDRHVISLSKVLDLQNFTINNGNLILDDCWFKGPMGNFILDKYLQGYGGITLGDNYPVFKEEGSFNISNPFNTGEYLDRMVHKAFEGGVEALSIKTCFDHLMMYVSGLKNKGKAGFPIEVTYGTYEDIFAVQVHFYSKQLNVLDFSTSLSSSISKKAEEYLLNVAVQSTDFFDFSYMPEVSKVVMTTLWTKDERIKFENRGLMITAVEGGVPLAQYDNENAPASITVSGKEIPDFSSKVTIPSSVPDEVSSTVVKGSEESEDGSTVVSGSANGEGESSTVVSGNELTEDEVRLVQGGEVLEEVIQTVKGKVEEDKSIFKLGGSKLDVDKTVFKIASSIDEATKEKNLAVRSLGDSLPGSIKTGLFDFAKDLNKSVDDLNAGDLEKFEVQRIPDILKNELEASLKVKSLPGNVVGNSESGQMVKNLEARLMTANSEKEKLKTQLKAMASEVRILKESRNKLAEIQAKASQAAGDMIVKDDPSEKERKELQDKIGQKNLNDQDLQKINSLLEKLKQEEIKIRKLELESTQKDMVFNQQLEKAEREVRAKDLMLIKSKESFTKLIEKKEKEIVDFKSKTDQLSKALTTGASSTNNQIMKDLEKQNQNLNKQVEMYKLKISSMATNLQPSKSEDNLKDEARKLQMLNQQMKNQLIQSKREVEKLQAKVASDNSAMMTLKQDKAKLEAELKKAAHEVKEKTAAVQNSQSDQELKRLQAQNQVLETQVKDSLQKITNLEAKLTEALKPQRNSNGPEEGSKVKVTQLENSVKKLTQDLIDAKNQIAEAKKETNKLRQDKTALQNQLDKMKKEADKAKSAAPKKPGGKAA